MKKIDGHYVVTRKPKVCITCSSKSIATVFYGFPSAQIMNDQKKVKTERRYKLEGCEIKFLEIEKAWYCNNCTEYFYTLNNTTTIKDDQGL